MLEANHRRRKSRQQRAAARQADEIAYPAVLTACLLINDFVTSIYKQATSTIPIVAYMGNPLEAGLVASLARPGGNITGITGAVGPEIGEIRLQLLKELVSSAARVAFLFISESEQIKYLREAAPRLGITLVDAPVRQASEAELRRAFDALVQDRPDAVYVTQLSEFYGQRRLIAELIEKSRLPAMFGHNVFVQLGGSISYSDDVLHALRQMAVYVDRVLKGAKPAELPIERPTQFILAINLKTAEALGLTVPQSILARANEVIE